MIVIAAIPLLFAIGFCAGYASKKRLLRDSVFLACLVVVTIAATFVLWTYLPDLKIPDPAAPVPAATPETSRL